MRALLFILLALLSTDAFADQPEIKVAFITDTTGPGSYWGTASKLGVGLAARDLSASGVPVKILYGEHSGKANQAVSEVQSVLRSESPDVIVTEFSSATNAVVEIVKQSKTPFLGNCGAASFLKQNEYAFKSSIEFDTGCGGLFNRFKELGKKKTVVLAGNGEFGERCLMGVMRIDASVPSVRFNMGDDLRSEVTKLVHDGFDSVILAGLETDAVQLLSNLSIQRSTIAVGFDQTLLSSKTINALAQEFTGEIYTFGLNKWPAKFAEELPKQIGYYNAQAAAYSYLAIKQLVTAVRQCSKGDLDCFRAAMQKSEPSPEFSFKGYDEDRVSRWDVRVRKFEKE